MKPYSYYKYEKHYKPASKGRVIFGAILSVLAALALLHVILLISRLSVTDENMTKANGVAFLGKFYQLLDNFMHGSFCGQPEEDTLIDSAAMAVVMFGGLLASFMDDALCLLPLGRPIRQHLGIHIVWVLRLIPAAIYGIYASICDFFKASKHSIFELKDYPLFGMECSLGIWIAQFFAIFIVIAFVLLLAEAFVNSGLLGLLVRVPLLLAMNLACSFIFEVLSIFAFVLISSVFFGVFGLIGLRLFSRSGRRERY